MTTLNYDTQPARVSLYTLLLKHYGYDCLEVFEVGFAEEPRFFEIRRSFDQEFRWASRHRDLFQTIATTCTLKSLGVSTRYDELY